MSAGMRSLLARTCEPTASTRISPTPARTWFVVTVSPLRQPWHRLPPAWRAWPGAASSRWGEPGQHGAPSKQSPTRNEARSGREPQSQETNSQTGPVVASAKARAAGLTHRG